MYRPQSQVTRQRSNDIRDLQSRTKKLSNKQYKQYAKRLIENNPGHKDADKQLKIDTLSSNRGELRQRIERKLGDQDKEMWRSGVVRFIKPKLTQRDYKRFKNLFEIFNKIQKTRHQIFNLTYSSSAKYIKESNNFYQNERLKELKENLLKLQLDEQKLLLQIQTQGKQNKINQPFSLEKVAKSYKRQGQIIQRKFADLESYDFASGSTKIQENQKSIVNENSSSVQNPDSEKRESCKIDKNSSLKQKQNLYLLELYEYMSTLDEKKQLKSAQKQRSKHRQNNNCEKIINEIKEFMYTKQNTINQLFVNLTNVNRINHKDFAQNFQLEKVSQSTMNSQFSKFYDIEQKNKSPHYNQTNKKYSSFKSLIHQIEQDLTQFKQMGMIKQRNNELAKKLLTTTKDLRKCQQEKNGLQKLLKSRKEEDQFHNIVKKENQLVHRKNQKLEEQNQSLKDQMQRLRTDIDQLKSKIQQSQNNTKQNSKFQKYYRQTLTLEQQVKILSDQNQKLVDEIKSLKLATQKKVQQQKQESEQKKNQKQKQSHQKSIKQCSTTSLIYKEFQKKNKKLSQQNNKLLQEVKQLKSRIEQQNDNKSQFLKQNQELIEQVQKLKKDGKFLQQQNHVLLEENKKIQEEFEYIVKEKLQLQSSLSLKVKQNQQLATNMENLKDMLKQKMNQVQQTVTQLRQHKQYLLRQVNMLQSVYKQMLQCFYEEITNALQIFIEGMSQQSSTNDTQQKIQQNLPNQQKINFQQQYRILAQQLNHCLFQLNSYKGMLDQVQIQKQLQKKYLEENISQLQIKIIKLEKQNKFLKTQLDHLKNIQISRHQTKIQKDYLDNATQTQITSNKRITSNILLISNIVSSPKHVKEQNRNHKLKIHLKQLQVKYLCEKERRQLKINCESFSINIEPAQSSQKTLSFQSKQIQTTQIQNKPLELFSNLISICEVVQNNCRPESQEVQNLLAFEDWIQQIKFDSDVDTYNFKNFCQINIGKQTSPNQLAKDQNEHLKQQNNRLKKQIQRLTEKQSNHMMTNDVMSPFKCILSPGDKVYTNFDNKQQNGDDKIRVMGSLYNQFNFPKLQHGQTKQQWNQRKNHQKQLQYHRHEQKQNLKGEDYPPLQPRGIRQSLTQKFHQTSRRTNSIQNKQPDSKKLSVNLGEEDDESFDLCII